MKTEGVNRKQDDMVNRYDYQRVAQKFAEPE